MTSLTKTELAAEVQALLDTPLTPTEREQLESCELQIELAGKTRFEQALIIGKMLSTIYNNALFRGEGGQRWDEWVAKRLPVILPEAGKLHWADRRRFLFEATSCLSASGSGRGDLTSSDQAEALQALIPRRYEYSTVGWNPAQLDQPAEGLIAVWELAQRIAVEQERKNGPTADDVRDAREELRPQLLEQGMIREEPKALKQARAERVQAAAKRKEQTVNVETEEQKAAKEQKFQEVMNNVKQRAPERRKAEQVDAVKEELSRALRERQEENIDLVREYNTNLVQTHKAINDLHTFMRKLRNIQGTERLAEMRRTEYLLINVNNDLERLKESAELFREVCQWAHTLDGPVSVDMTTINV